MCVFRQVVLGRRARHQATQHVGGRQQRSSACHITTPFIQVLLSSFTTIPSCHIYTTPHARTTNTCYPRATRKPRSTYVRLHSPSNVHETILVILV